MQNRHLIDTTIFDIGFTDEDSAFAAQSELDTLVKRDLLAVIEEVFDAASAAGRIMRIPQLEVDLGTVAYPEYQHELPRRLRERLTASLLEYPVSTTPGQQLGSSVIDRRQADYAQLEYFLLYGCLPWYSTLGDAPDLAGLLDRVLHDDPLRLKNLLSSTTHRQVVLARLTHQFPLQSRVRVLHTLSPALAPAVSELMHELRQTWHKHDHLLKSLGLALDEAMAAIWRSVLQLILGRSAHQYSPEELLARALCELLNTGSKINRELITEFVLQAGQQSNGQPSRLSLSLQPLLEEQISPVPGHEQPVKAPDSRQLIDEGSNEQTRKDEIISAFKAAIESADARSIQSLWYELLTEQASLLARTLYRYGQQAQFRKKLVQVLSHAQLSDILALIEPRENAFVARVIEQHTQFRPRQVSPSAGKDQTIRQLWEFSLGYLLVERGSRFNKKSYLASVLRQMAASENMHFQDLLQDLLGNLDTHMARKAYVKQMRDLLLELQDEQSRERQEANRSTANQARHGYRLYEQLRLALTDGASGLPGGEARLLEIIVELQRDFPWQLLRILRELQSASISRSATAARLPRALLQALVMAFIEMTSQAPSGGASDLLDAVKKHAKQVEDQHEYFQRLLNCLIKREIFDFDVITASAKRSEHERAASAQQGSVDETQPSEKVTGNAELTDKQAAQRLAQYLHGEIELSPALTAALIMHIGSQLQHQPLRFLQSVRRLAGQAKQIERLIRLLPEDLLARIAVELAGQPVQRMLQIAELITLGCYSEQLGITYSMLPNIKWQFVFRYLAESGQLFNEQTFVQDYLATLATHSLRHDPQQLRSLLAQQLLVDALPATRELSLRLVEILNNPASDSHTEQPRAVQSIDRQGLAQLPEPVAYEQEVSVDNAGLVLAAPYLPRLFEMLELTEKSTFKDLQAQLRAVHLLQYLVEEQSDSPEYRLFLNKLLCGVPSEQSLPRQIKLSGHETQTVDGLLRGMIDNWKVLGNTSVAGLRESFLQREGRLQRKAEDWQLRVASRSFDMLLDQLPWGFKTIKYPWMEGLIHVEWR